MSRSENPLSDMSKMFAQVDALEGRPDDSFQDQVLPGFKQVLNARRSIRVFDGEPIPAEVFRDCLRDAVLAPSSSNLQTYQLYWLREPVKKRAVAAACLGQAVAATAGELVVVVARGDLWNQHRLALIEIMTQNGEKPLPGPAAEYYEKIVPLVMKTDIFGVHNLVRRLIYWFRGRKGPSMRAPIKRADHRIYAHVQATFAAQTLLLSLTAHGYDSCPIGGMDAKRIAEILGLPGEAEVSLVIAAGRGKPEGLFGRRVRLPESALIQEV